MQTVEEVEKHVPVREGDYGERVATVEPGGVEYIALRERHGKPIQLFWTWLSPNLEFATIFVGFIAVLFFGLNLWEAATAIIVGSALGSVTMAVVSSWGPKFGVPMMVQSRAAFGWFIVNSVSGSFALQALFPSLSLPFWLTFLVIVLAQVAIATLGHNLIHVFEQWALPLLGVVFGVACIFIFVHGNYGYAATTSTPVGGWLLAFTAAFGYAAGWNPYGADYTRYMDPKTNRFMVGLWAGLGVFISCVVLELAGAVLVTVSGFNPAGIPTAQLQHAMPDIVYYPTLLCIAIGAVAANAINIYSGTMSLVAIGIREVGLTLKQRRAALAVIAGVIGYFGGLYLEAHNYQDNYTNFLLLISYWIAPWEAVVFVDYWMRRGNFGDETVFYDTKHQRWQGALAMLLGLVISIGLFSNNAIYTGPIPKANANFGDITFIVGFIVTAILYYAFASATRKDMTAAGAAGSRAA